MSAPERQAVQVYITANFKTLNLRTLQWWASLAQFRFERQLLWACNVDPHDNAKGLIVKKISTGYSSFQESSVSGSALEELNDAKASC